MMIRALRVAGFLTAMILATPSDAQPTNPSGGGAVAAACRSDYQAHCAGVPPGGKEAVQCLRQNAAQSTPACRAALAALPTEQQLDAVRSACRMDYISNCFGVPLGGSDALQCLKAHAAQSSSGCREAMATLP